MNSIKRILFVLGYITFVGPPRALEMSQSENRHAGELAGKPIWIALLAEAMLRGVTLVLLAVVAETVLGNFWYNWLHIDLMIGVIIMAGSGHMIAYYLFLLYPNSRAQAPRHRAYRLVRNLCYALLPGLPVAAGILLFDGLKPAPEASVQFIVSTYTAIYIFCLVLGLFEALRARRRPLGVGLAG